MCDQISDAILDAHLKQDPDAKVACGNYHLFYVLKAITREAFIKKPFQNAIPTILIENFPYVY